MNNLSLRSVLETNKLVGPNFLDWHQDVRLVLRQVKIEYVLDTPIPVTLEAGTEEAGAFDAATQKKHQEVASQVQCVMLLGMPLELQRQHEKMGPFEMLKHLKDHFDSVSRFEIYEVMRLFRCRLTEGGKVSPHVLKMLGLNEKLVHLGIELKTNISIYAILQCLPDSYLNFVVNFNMNKTKATMSELHNMLKSFKSFTAKEKLVIMVSVSTSPVSKGKKKRSKGKKDFKPKSNF